MSAHTCHALRCTARCKPEHLMCPRHWRMVPPPMQKRVRDTYQPGQCDGRKLSKAWIVAAVEARCVVAVAEGVMTWENAARRVAISAGRAETPA